jgi:5-(carboxyamino)imidazole ribonucleotide synthase
LREKKAIVAAGAPVAPYREIGSLEDLQTAVAELGLPSVLKTATGGYDGKGQFVIRRLDQVEEAFRALEPAKTELVLEQFIRFEKEVSVIAARNPDGQVKTFPVAENIHVDNILHVSIVPARIAEDVAERAEKLAKSIAETLNVVGLIAVELFVTADGELYVNELAPRPHNSGHYTMEACRTSQFEQHLRAICNLPLGDTSLMQPVVMVNLLGQHVAPTLAWMKTEDATAVGMTAKVHLYGKEEAKAQRKMGHINILTEDLERTLKWIETSPIWRDIYEGRN